MFTQANVSITCSPKIWLTQESKKEAKSVNEHSGLPVTPVINSTN